jgi:integrase
VDDTPNDEAVTVPLTNAALAILETRQANQRPTPGQKGLSKFVFLGRGRHKHLMEPKTAWRRILERAGITDLRIHDLRRTFGAYQACAGSSLPIIGQSLGHKSIAATQIYARINRDPVRASVNKAVNAMLTAGGLPLLVEHNSEK